MKRSCPFCVKCPALDAVCSTPIRFGTFRRNCDGRILQRYRCRSCQKTFSTATFDICYRQHKRSMNAKVFKLLVSGVSQRRTALILKLNRKTVVRKFLFLGEISFSILCEENFAQTTSEFQFDELETFEHTKCKPLSVALAVDSKTRRILAFSIAKMPAKGLLAKKAFKKYGYRVDERASARRELFLMMKNQVTATGVLKSDQNPHYLNDIKTHFPGFVHETSKGRRGAVTGQGELKKIGFDPLFSLNHTCAMLRANINRLFRKTWCTTKKSECLHRHIAMYALFHNQVLI